MFLYGAGDQVRTDDIFLGKEVLYQLSYTRILLFNYNSSVRGFEFCVNSLPTVEQNHVAVDDVYNHASGVLDNL